MCSKIVSRIEEKMENLDQNSVRYQILNNAKSFKTSWIELGRGLYSVFKDKMFKEWGYNSFDTYAAKEIGIRKDTALKLLRSYFFLEKEEPAYLKKDYLESCDAAATPSYEAVDVLRQAKGKKVLGAEDYSKLKREILEKGRDAKEVKKDLTGLIRERKELDPEEAWEKKKQAGVKRFLSLLKSLKQELESSKLLPAATLKEADALIRKIEEEISG
jgi:hypothetical protein